MFLHNKKMMFPVRVGATNAEFAKMLLEQFGGPNGELAAAMRYFTQAVGESDIRRRDMLMDIATEELSHLEMVAQTIVQLCKGTSSSMVDEVEGSYLGDMLDGKHEKYVELGLNSGQNLLGGSGPRLTDSCGNPWKAEYIDSIGHPAADLRSDIAAEARAKIVYERLIKLCDDADVQQTLTFLMTREVAHQKMFEAALAALPNNFPPGNLASDERFTNTYFEDHARAKSPGFELANSNEDYPFKKMSSDSYAEQPPLPQAHPSTESRLPHS